MLALISVPKMEAKSFSIFCSIFSWLFKDVFSIENVKHRIIGSDKHGTNVHTEIHALSDIRIHDPSVRVHALDFAATVTSFSFIMIRLSDTMI
jgi:hypothetical protein